LLRFDDRPGSAVMAWLMIAFFGSTALFAAAMLLPRAGSLTLTARGFTLWSLFRKYQVLWPHVVHIAGSTEYLTLSYRDPGSAGDLGPILRWDSDNQLRQGDRQPVRYTGRETDDSYRRAGRDLVTRTFRVVGNFGLPVGDLARLMQAWREYAIYGPPFPILTQTVGGNARETSVPPQLRS
jgi:hypothetical protein